MTDYEPYTYAAPRDKKTPQVWILANQLWDILRADCDPATNLWRGSLTAIFRAWDERGNQSRVTRALRLMGRIETVKPGRSGTPQILRLQDPELPLTIEEYHRHQKEIQEAPTSKRRTMEFVYGQRLDDAVRMISELAIEVEELRNRVAALEGYDEEATNEG